MYTDYKINSEESPKNPLFEHIGYNKYCIDMHFDSQLMLMLQNVFKELNYCYNRHAVVYQQILTMMRQNKLVNARTDADKKRMDVIIHHIRTTVVVNNGKVTRVAPPDDLLPISTTLTHNIDIERSIHNAQIVLPVEYSYEIILLPKLEAIESVSMYNYEAKISNYYIKDRYVVNKGTLINIPLEILCQPDYKLLMSTPYVLNGVGKYLSGKDFLNLRLICKGTNNQVKDYKSKVIGRHVLDIFFKWFQDYYHENRTILKALMTYDEYKLWKRDMQSIKYALLVKRQYAMDDYVYNSTDNYMPVSMTCDLHERYNCEVCNHGSRMGDMKRYFHWHRGMSPEITSLMSYLIGNRILLVEEIPNIFDSSIIFVSEAYMVYLIYDYLVANGKKMSEGAHKVFKKYRQYVFYFYMVDKSSISNARALDPPRWSDIIKKNLYFDRNKRVMRVCYKLQMQVEATNLKLYSYRQDSRDYFRRPELEIFFLHNNKFKDDEYSGVDEKIMLFFKKNRIRHHGNLNYLEKEGEKDPHVWNTENISDTPWYEMREDRDMAYDASDSNDDV